MNSSNKMYIRSQECWKAGRQALMLILASGVCLLGTARASDAGVFISSGGLRMEGQTGWVYYQGDDSPEGGYRACCGSWGSQIVADVALGQTVAAGDYTLFIKVLDYDCHSRVDATFGNASASAPLNDRDVDRYWTKLGPLRLTTATSSARFVFTKTLASSIQARILFRALYLVPDTNNNIVVTAADQFMKLQFPTAADYDDSPPVKGNLLANSSFEVGVGGGWTSVWPQRSWAVRSLWDTNVAYRGNASLRMESQPSPPQHFMSLPIRLRPNKRYTLSAYIRSSGARQWVGVSLLNSLKPPTGMPAAPVYSGGKLMSASPNWERIVFSDRILAYPGDQFHITLWCQQYGEGGGSVWFDCIQLEEGGTGNYQPRDAIDLGVLMPTADSIFYPNDVQGQLFVANHSSRTVVGTVKYEIDDHMLRVLKQGTIPVSLGGNSRQSYPLPLDVQKLGSLRGTVWTEDMPAAEEEFLYSVVPVPSTTGLDESSTIGIHSDHTDWQMGMLQRAGIKWSRSLSPSAHFRWNLVEPTEGSFVWVDALVQLPKNYGVTLLGNIGENAPAWAHRTYFTVSNVAGAFRLGEAVRTASGASGNIALVLDSTSATGWALQLTNVQGAYAQGASITGQVSQATALISSPIYPTSFALDKWETFVRAIVSHYQGDVKWWEIWNEPHLDAEVPNATFYAEMLKRAIRVIKIADSEANIVAMGGIFRPDYGIEVISKLPSNWTNDVAVLSGHFYPGNGPMASLLAQTPEFKGKPIWNTETGTWDWGGFVGVNANVLRAGIQLYGYRANERFYRSAVDSPVLLARNFLQSVGSGARKYFYYDGRNSVSYANNFASAPTLIDYNEGLKPKGVAYAILAHLFDHSTGMGAVTTASTKTEAYLFDRAGVPSVGIFSTDGTEQEMDLSGFLGASSIQVFDFMGNPVPSPTAKVRYGRLPVYVAGVGVSISQLRQAFQRGPIRVVPDTEAPRLSITVSPRRPVAVGDEVYLRWLALDNVSLPDQVQPDALMYSYKLLGEDVDWAPWSAGTSISYNDLPTGRYTFSVKVRDQAGNISAEQLREIIVGTPRVNRPVNLRKIP